MPKKQEVEKEKVVIYDEPSEQYPDLMRALDIPKSQKMAMKTKLLEAAELKDQMRPLKKREKQLMDEVVQICIDNEIELPFSVWCGIPWNIRYATSTRITSDLMLAHGVTPDQIRAILNGAKTQSEKPSFYPVANRRSGDDED